MLDHGKTGNQIHEMVVMVDTKTGDTGCDGRCVLFPDEQLYSFLVVFFNKFVVIVARESAGSCAVVFPSIQSTGKTHHFFWLEFHLCHFALEDTSEGLGAWGRRAHEGM